MNSGRPAQTKQRDVDLRMEVQAQEVVRLRALLRDQQQAIRNTTRAEIRSRYRVAIVGLMIAGLVIGGLIGHYGFTQSGDQSRSGASGAPTALNSAAPLATTKDRGPADSTAPTPWPIRVYVSGAVAKSQVVEMPPGSLVADAIEAAGGATSDADLDALNLAAVLMDNQQIAVPSITHRAGATPELPDEQTSPHPIDINRASCEELATLPYIGETKAADIIAYRTAHGPFTRPEDIQKVSGIGPATFEHIADLITTEP